MCEREEGRYALRPARSEEIDEIFSLYESLGYHAVGQCEDGSYAGVKRQKEL